MAFGMRVVGYEPYVDTSQLPQGVEMRSILEDALHEGDYVTLHVAGTQANRGLIGVKQLAAMRANAVLINTTRGMVVNEDALFDALVAGKISGAALDVFLHEPVRRDERLVNLENVIVTPHNAGNTHEAKERMASHCVQNILSFYRTGRPDWCVDANVFRGEKVLEQQTGKPDTETKEE